MSALAQFLPRGRSLCTRALLAWLCPRHPVAIRPVPLQRIQGTFLNASRSTRQQRISSMFNLYTNFRLATQSIPTIEADIELKIVTRRESKKALGQAEQIALAEFGAVAASPSSGKASLTTQGTDQAQQFWRQEKKDKSAKNWSVRLQNKPENSGRNQYERMHKKQKFIKVYTPLHLLGKVRAIWQNSPANLPW